MSGTEITLVLEGDEAVMKELAEHARTSALQASVREIKGHAGDLGTWLAIVQAATPLIAAFIPYLLERSKGGKITKVTVGDWSVEGTLTPADVRELQEVISRGNRP